MFLAFMELVIFYDEAIGVWGFRFAASPLNQTWKVGHGSYARILTRGWPENVARTGLY